MPGVVFEDVRLVIPGGVKDFDTFTAWTRTPHFPTHARLCYIADRIWMDSSREQYFTHNRLKIRIASVLDGFTVGQALGDVFGDRARVNVSETGLSAEPDVVFVSFDARRTGRVALSAGPVSVSIDGPAEVVVEVVSNTSEKRDTVELRRAYFKADVREYWLVDARGENVAFDILYPGPVGFVETKAQPDGWLKSVVLGHSFRLVQTADPFGNPQYTLEHRA